MPDQPGTTRTRSIVRRNTTSRSSMIAASAVSFFKQSKAGLHTAAHATLLEEDEESGSDDDGNALFYDTIYPLSYDRELLTFDVLDYYFLATHLGGPTWHKFTREPLDVLDVGCGAGTWMIETARQWVLTHFVGLDANVDMHPSLDFLQPPDLRNRIRWVQSDFLEKLPFRDASFDFVRVAKIALAVPEPKWPRLIAEISRVLRPGGTLEIIEENLIFPLPPVRPLIQAPEERAGATVNTQTTSKDSVRSTSGGYNGRPSISSELLFTQNSTPHVSGLSSPPPYASADLPEYTLRAPDADEAGSPLDRSGRDPRDHRKLKKTWEAMLAGRGINTSPLSILQLYVLAEFEDLDSSASPVVVPIPGPSHTTQPYFDSDASDDEDCLDKAGLASAKSGPGETSGETPLHLLRSLATILACRRAMLPHFYRLFPEYANKEREKHGRRRLTLVLHEFDAQLANYERDMLDRVGMGQRLKTTLGWKPPVNLPKLNDSTDEFQRWRRDIRMWRGHEQDVAFDPDVDEGVCRTLRIFSATKRSLR